jgi:hypothetical protein
MLFEISSLKSRSFVVPSTSLRGERGSTEKFYPETLARILDFGTKRFRQGITERFIKD